MDTILKIAWTILVFITLVALFVFVHMFFGGGMGLPEFGAHIAGHVGNGIKVGYGHISKIVNGTINKYLITMILAGVFLLTAICVAPASLGTAFILFFISLIFFNIGVFYKCSAK